MKSFKQQCIELRKKDHTLNEIVAITGKGKSSIYPYIKDIPLSEGKRLEIAENSRKQARRIANMRRGVGLRPFKPFDVWTPEMVLLAAHLMFDGEISKTCAYNNRSPALINRFQRHMASVYEFKPKRYLNKTTGVHRVSYNNVAMAAFFKNKRVELLNTISILSIDCQREFLRAFFDDEGCMDFRVKRRRVRGYQKDKAVLICVQRLLKNFEISSTLKGKNEVVITGKENLIKFKKEINFSKGVRINPKRTNSIWKKNFEKRKLLEMAIKSFRS